MRARPGGEHVRPGPRVLAGDRRTFTLALSAGLAGVTAAALFGSLAPLHSTWTASGGSGGGSGAAGGPPQVNVPWAAVPLGSPAGSPVSQPPPRPGPVPASTRPVNDRAPGKPSPHQQPTTHQQHQQHQQPTVHQQHQQPGTHRKTAAHRKVGAHRKGQPDPGTTATGMTAGAHDGGSAPPVVVSYLVDREWAGGFQGQVRIVNRGPRPIAGWQAIIALPRDRVTWFWNAGGLVSHHVMLLQPAGAAEVVAAGGGTLSVFFTATGPETTPLACAFDGVPCG